MTTEHRDDELTPAQRQRVADVFYKLGIVVCLIVGAAILSGTPIMVAGQYAPPGLLAISFGLFLRDFSEGEVSGEE